MSDTACSTCTVIGRRFEVRRLYRNKAPVTLESSSGAYLLATRQLQLVEWQPEVHAKTISCHP